MAAQELNGKVVVVTGASSGLGRGTALGFAAAGASVVVSARRGEALEELVGECEAAGGKALAVTTDVSDAAQVEALAQAAVTQFGRIDIWVNNAGGAVLGRFEEIPLTEHIQVINTDLLGTLYGSYYALRQFKTQGEGNLINVASVIGKIPAPYFASYAAAKHGVVGMDGAIRQELAENSVKNIHVCTVLPASMDTTFFEHAANYTGHKPVPIPPVYSPQEGVDVILRLAVHPENEAPVGNAGGLFMLSDNIAPGLTEAIMGKQTHMALIEKSDPAPDTGGGLQQPSAVGTGVKSTESEK